MGDALPRAPERYHTSTQQKSNIGIVYKNFAKSIAKQV